MKAIKDFLKKEIKDNMFDRELFGIKYWEFVRVPISFEVNTVIENSSSMFAKNKLSIKRYIPNIKTFNNYFLKKRKADILFISQSRRANYKGKFRNNYIDYYIDYLKKDYEVLTLEEPAWSSLSISNRAHEFPIYTDNVFFTDFHEIAFIIKRTLYKFFRYNKYRKIVKEYYNVRKIVNSWYNSDNINFKKPFVNTLIRLCIDKKYIKRLLKKINPKIVMLHYMPSNFKEMLIMECNNQNITTIEVQHGTITKVDPLINKCFDVSKLNAMTKYIFSFGENQVNKYALSIENTKNVIPIGFPFFEEIMKKIKQKRKKYILVISQSTIGNEMANFTSELSKLLINSNIKIIFKYHPNEMSRDYQCLKKSNIIEIKNERSIYDIQSESILQIGSYSTSLYEGFAMKVPTLIVKTMFGSIETVDIFNNITKGVYFINSPNDVLKYIDKKNIIPDDKDIEKLWQKNAKINLIKNIKKIMEEEKWN